MTRSGSEIRRRNKVKSTRFSEDEYGELVRRSKTAGLSTAAYIRQQCLDIVEPPPKRKGQAPEIEGNSISKTLTFSFPEDSAAELVRRANIATISPASFILQYCLDVPPPRHSRQSKLILSPELRSSLCRILSELGILRSEFGKIGSNMNQIAKAANLNRHLAGMHESALADFEAALVDFVVMRSEIMRALGDER